MSGTTREEVLRKIDSELAPRTAHEGVLPSQRVADVVGTPLGEAVTVLGASDLPRFEETSDGSFPIDWRPALEGVSRISLLTPAEFPCDFPQEVRLNHKDRAEQVVLREGEHIVEFYVRRPGSTHEDVWRHAPHVSREHVRDLLLTVLASGKPIRVEYIRFAHYTSHH